MRILSLLFLLGVGCDTPDNTDACDLFEDHMACPECYDGDVTCSAETPALRKAPAVGAKQRRGSMPRYARRVSPTSRPNPAGYGLRGCPVHRRVTPYFGTTFVQIEARSISSSSKKRSPSAGSSSR